jgi:predicted ATP-grasp superfamily ATP-dependent carboligase
MGLFPRRVAASEQGESTVALGGLVVDARLYSSLAAIRALGRGGVRVAAMADVRRATGLWSRYADRTYVGPDASLDGAGFLATLGRAVASEGPVAIYPSHEATLDVLLAARDALPADAVLPYPDTAVLQRLRDKRLLPELTAGTEIRGSATAMEGTAADLLDGAPPAFPCVIKGTDPSSSFTRTLFPSSTDEFRALLGELSPEEQILIQDKVDGRLLGLALVLDRGGQLVAAFQQEVEHSWPVGGPACRAVSVEPDQELLAAAAEVLRGAGYWGFAQLDIIVGPDSPCLIDINPRLYDSLALAVGAGANLPHAWHCVALGEPVPKQGPYSTGVAFRWLERELSARVRGGPQSLFQRPPAPRVGQVWAADDPLPGALAAVNSPAEMALKRLRLMSRSG